MELSVVIPAYNRAHTLRRAIGSVRSQGLSDLEVIVVDDNSTDDTEHVVKSMGDIRYLRNNKQLGPAGARNRGIECSNGDYISFLDSDDVWAPGHIDQSLGAIRRHGLDACYSLWYRQKGSHWEEYNSAWIDILVKDLGLTVDQGVILLNDGIAEYTLYKPFWCFHTDTLVAKRDIFECGMLFNEDLKSAEDVEFSFRLLLYNRVGFINKYHAYYYEGDDNIVALRAEVADKLSEHKRNLVKAFRRIRDIAEYYPCLLHRDQCLRQLDKRIADCL